MNVNGEGDMAQRWLSRCTDVTLVTRKEPMAQEKKNFLHVVRRQCSKWFIRPAVPFLNAKIGETSDDIVVGPTALCVDRKSSHPFRELS